LINKAHLSLKKMMTPIVDNRVKLAMVRVQMDFLGQFLLWPRFVWDEMDYRAKWIGVMWAYHHRTEQLA
jgi:hypothetical protein